MAKSKPNPEDQRPDTGDVTAMAHGTNIDRRECERVVPMRVLALGVSRTGTSSLRQALIDLGYNDTYHYATPLQENPPDRKMWIEAWEAKFEGKGKPFTREDWDQLLGHCQAVTDTPCTLFYQELLEAYPDAKVILTIRDNPDQWIKSQMATIIPWIETNTRLDVHPLTRMYRWFVPFDSITYRFTDLQVKHSPMFQCLVNDYHDGTETAKQWYLDYIEEIKTIVPKEKLLVMNVKEGWKPLCEFLGQEEPLYPFPKKNDTATFKRNTEGLGEFLDRVAKMNMLKTAGAVLAVGVAAAMGAHRYGFLKAPSISVLRT